MLDLRDNSGGAIGLGIDVASQLLPGGAPFVTFAGREGQEERMFLKTESPTTAIRSGGHVVCVLGVCTALHNSPHPLSSHSLVSVFVVWRNVAPQEPWYVCTVDTNLFLVPQMLDVSSCRHG